MTDLYYTKLFPATFLQTRWFPATTGAPATNSGLVFRVQAETGYGDDIRFEELNAAFVETFLVGGDERKRALHSYSSIARPFAIDFDFKDPEAQTPEALDRWWEHVRAVVHKVESGLMAVIKKREVMGPMDTQSGNIEPLWCWTGKRGVHLYIHPSLRWHRAPTQWRKRILEEGLELLQEEDTQWVDRPASMAGDSAKSLRVPFSPHAQSPSNSICTPLGTWSSTVSEMVRHPLNCGAALGFDQVDAKAQKRMQETIELVERWIARQ